MEDIKFRAYANNYASTIGSTPAEAAALFFEKNVKARKCDIVAGVHADGFFTVSYGRKSKGEWPESYNGVTRSTKFE